jgi:hypothetical protein
MKKFLGNLGKVLLQVGATIPQLSPFLQFFTAWVPQTPQKGVLGTVQAVTSDITKSMQIIAMTEADVTLLMGPGNGPDKLKLAAPKIGILFETAIDDLGLKITDEAAAATAISNITSNLADLLNACAKK